MAILRDGPGAPPPPVDPDPVPELERRLDSVSVAFSEPIKERIRKAAAADGVSMSAWVNLAARQRLARVKAQTRGK